MPLLAPDSDRFIGNVMFVPPGDQLATWPAHNDATPVPLVFANPVNGNYELVSPYWTDTMGRNPRRRGYERLESSHESLR